MSGFPVKSQIDIARFRKQYLDTLALQANINELNYRANQLYIKTGAPSAPTDQRSTDERLADLYRLKIDVRTYLGEIMSGDDAELVSERLNEDEIIFLAQQANILIPDLKKKYRLGVPADIFLQYLREYMRKFQEQDGVDIGAEIRNLIPRREQINGIRVAVNNLGNVNVPMELRDEVNENMDGLGVLSEDILRVIRQAVTMENAMLRDDIFERLNDMMEDIPTKADLDELLKKLSIANQKRDSVMAEGILNQMATMTQFAGGIQEDLALLNKKLEEAGVQAVPVPAQVFTEIDEEALAQMAGEPFAKAENIPLYSIPLSIEELRSFKTKEPFVSYIQHLRKLTGGARGDERFMSLFADTELFNIAPSSFRDRKREVLRDVLTRPIVQERIRELYQERMPPLKKGDGIGRMKGKGLKKTKPVDFSAGIMSEPDYVPFGKFIINRKRLVDGICMIKRLNGQFMPDMKTKRISPNLTTVFRKVAGGSLPNFNELEKLDDDEREYLKHISKKCNLSSKFEVPSPKKDKSETLINKFEVMRGQIIAGNDSKDLIKNFKKILIEMLEQNLLPTGQVKEILIELARMEV